MKNALLLLVFSTLLALSLSGCGEKETDAYFTSFDGTKIHYEVLGQGEPVVLIHGFTGTGSDWKNAPVTDSLLAHGFKTILIDLRGNGLSDKPDAPEAYAGNAEAKDIMELMKELHIKEYDAVGYSRGSIILASLLVLDKNCKRAVIGGMGPDFTNPMWPRRIGFYNALMDESIEGYEGFRAYIAKKELDPKVLAAQQKEQPATSKAQLGKITRPVLIVCGDEDSDNGKGSDLQPLFPNATFAEVPGTHNTTQRTPGFAREVTAFLTR